MEILEADNEYNLASFTVFLEWNSCWDCLQCAIAPWIGFSISDFALLLLFRNGSR
jgi:hypothetical protein